MYLGKSALFSASALAAVSFAGAALAQDAVETGRSNTIEELVVTAQKREEALQDVPVAVSAYTDETRDLVGIRTIQDFATFTPGLSFNAGTDRMSLRGVGRLTNVLGSDPGVAVYNDGFYTASNSEASKSPLLVDRVEILRGPQGTLYGRNSIGGAINVISKRPDTAFGGEVRAIYGNYDYKLIEGTVTGPITEGLRIRLSGTFNDQDKGYFKNIAGGKDEGGVVHDYFLEGQLEADIGERGAWWVKYTTASWDRHGRTSNVITPYFNTADASAAAFVRPEALFPSSLYLYNTPNPGVNDIWEINTNQRQSQKLRANHQIVTHFTYDFDSFQVKYVGGYNQYYYRQYSDYDNTSRLSYQYDPPGPVPVANIFPDVISEYIEDKKYWSNEVNISSTHDGPLQWIVGYYRLHEKYKQPITLYTPNQANVATPLIGVSGTPGAFTSLAAPNPQRLIFYSFGDLETDTQAAFGQVDYAISEQFKITAGLRYTKDKKQAIEASRLIFYSPTTIPSAAGGFAIDITSGSGGRGPATRALSDSWDAWSGTLGGEWTPDDDTLVYAKYSRGYKSGGFNLGALALNPAVDSEFSDAYEVGLKKNFGATLQTNAAVFYYDYRGAQVPVSVVRNGVNQSEFVNIEESRSYGLEVETIWAPTDALRFLINYSYLNAKIEEACCIINSSDLLARDPNATPSGPLIGGRQGQDLSGNSLPSSPKHKLAVNGTYRFDFEPGSLTLSATYSWKDKVSYGIFDYGPEIADSQDQLDARVIWTDAADRFTVIDYVRNAFDAELLDGVAVGAENAGSIKTITLTPPRTYGVEVQYRF